MIYAAILGEKVDDFNRRYTQLRWRQQDRARAAGVLDEVIAPQPSSADDGTPYRAFVTRADKSYGFPSKDRSGRLDAIEEPDLASSSANAWGATS